MRLTLISCVVITLYLLVPSLHRAAAPNNFLYVTFNFPGSNAVTAFSVAPDGNLTQIDRFSTGGAGGGTIFEGQNPICVSGRRLYVANPGSSDVTGFDISPSSGVLTRIPGSPFPTGGDASLGASLDCAPSGQFLLVANVRSKNISVFRIDSSGALSLVPGGPFPICSSPNGIKVHPNGRVLYVAESEANQIEVLKIASDGTLTPVAGSPFPGGPPALGVGVVGIDINCAGTLLFVPISQANDTRVSVYGIGVDGVLTPIPGSPLSIPMGSDSVAAVLSLDERFLFVLDQLSNVIVVLSVDSSGSLSLHEHFFNPGVSFPMRLAINNTGEFLFANNFIGGISSFIVGTNGALTRASGSPFPLVHGGLPAPMPGLAVYPRKSCKSFDSCIQDESTGIILKLNSTTGDYQVMNCSGLNLDGAGSVIKKGNIITLQDYSGDKRVSARIDRAVNRGIAAIKLISKGTTLTIFDTNLANDTCICSQTPVRYAERTFGGSF